jgi:hypothetical protein
MAMNLHAIAAPFAGIVSGTTIAVWRRNTGYTTSAAGKRAAGYTDVPDTPLQVQALTGPELELVESLNIQGVKRAVHMEGDAKGVDRASGEGGDLLVFGGAVWLVTLVLETWDASNWCRVAVTKQNDVVTP